jgi:hypothetical protein
VENAGSKAVLFGVDGRLAGCGGCSWRNRVSQDDPDCDPENGIADALFHDHFCGWNCLKREIGISVWTKSSFENDEYFLMKDICLDFVEISSEVVR